MSFCLKNLRYLREIEQQIGMVNLSKLKILGF